MSDARALFGAEPDVPGVGTALLRELALMRLLLEAIRTDVQAIRQEVEELAAAPPPPTTALSWDGALPPDGAAPLTAGGGASYPGFPASFRRTGGSAREGGR